MPYRLHLSRTTSDGLGPGFTKHCNHVYSCPGPRVCLLLLLLLHNLAIRFLWPFPLNVPNLLFTKSGSPSLAELVLRPLYPQPFILCSSGSEDSESWALFLDLHMLLFLLLLLLLLIIIAIMIIISIITAKSVGLPGDILIHWQGQ